MPIRINLLAEQQAAEEARRRDPVKRAIWAGAALAAMMILWAVLLQLRLASARAELSRYSNQLQAVEENSKEARLKSNSAGQLESRITNLQRYSTNRFFCATALDAIQQVMSEDIRVVQFQTVHSYSTNSESTYKTNIAFPIQKVRAWQFWKGRSSQPNVLTLVSNQLAVITNKVEALKGSALPLITRIEVTTNGSVANAKIEVTKPVAAVERVQLTIKARDYANPPGKRVDEFSKAIAAHPYFNQRLVQAEGEGIRLRERAIQPEFDPGDSVSASKPFVPFVIECRYRETLRANE